jgi:hypothetical protein
MEYYDEFIDDASVYSSGNGSNTAVGDTKTVVSNRTTGKKRDKTSVKSKEPVYFKSNSIGKRIVYGNTGIVTPHIVGTADEDLYFKVKMGGKSLETDVVTLFYDNPRDFCVHYLTSLSKKKKVKKESQEFILERIEKMLYEMEPVIKVWLVKRNAAMSVELAEIAASNKNYKVFEDENENRYIEVR